MQKYTLKIICDVSSVKPINAFIAYLAKNLTRKKKFAWKINCLSL